MFDYTNEMNLEFFANENDLDLAQNDWGDLFIIVNKEDKSKDDLIKLIDSSGFDFEIEELESFYKIY